MTRNLVLFSAAAVGGLLALAPAQASAQSWGVYVGTGSPDYRYYDRYYDREARENWREEQRERWEARRRWERAQARREWYRERWERRRAWRDDDDD